MIRLKSITKVYKKRMNDTLLILDKISLDLFEGQSTAIIGVNGSGKTTLLNVIGGLVPADSGQIIFNNHIIHETERKRRLFLREHVGYIPQNCCLLPDISVYENVAMPLKFRGISNSLINNKAMKILKSLGMEHKTDCMGWQLSGGERQRVAIARAMIKEPSIIIADEPTSSLDEDSARFVIELLLQHSAEGKILVLVSHSIELVSNFSEIYKLDNNALCKLN
jgi:putative ABC transport system ATP-binding protein